MTEDVAFFHGGNITVIKMKIRTTDCGRGDLNDGIARIDDARLRNVEHLNVLLPFPTNCLHDCSFFTRRATLPLTAALRLAAQLFQMSIFSGPPAANSLIVADLVLCSPLPPRRPF